MTNTPAIISRNKINALTETHVNGEVYFLGEHRDFRNHNNLSSFLDGETDVSISWVHLKNGEQLNVHTHPIKSMIIICSGTGLLLGDVEAEISEGDIVIVPSNARHGFRAIGQNGFHGLSIQFEQQSLYAKGKKPNVQFMENREKQKEDFLNYNLNRIQRHLDLPIFKMIKDGTIKDKMRMERMLSFLKTWSSYFQKLVMLRVVATSSTIFDKIAKQHLIEEFGHDSLLKETPLNDPILKSIATWFVHQMICRSDLEKHIIVHCVLENGAHCFHSICAKYLSNTADSYFNVHVEHDSNHSMMGIDTIIVHFSYEKESILGTLDEAWDMLDLLFVRAYEIVNQLP